MDQIRNFGTQNKSLIVNFIYIAAVAVIVYYLVNFYNETNSKSKSLLGDKVSANGMTPTPYVIDDGASSNKIRRIKKDGRYTLSAWFYLSSQPQAQTSLLTIQDQAEASNTATRLLEVGLYPASNKMYIRSATGGTGLSAVSLADASSSTTMPMCDVLDVDYQRWIQVTVVVNGRIMDVYMDGKLARSCVLPAGQYVVDSANEKSKQAVVVTAFEGYYSGLYFMADADTPDSIYARYQMGPYSKASFLAYLSDKMGVKVTYAGAKGERKTFLDGWFE